MVRSTGFEPATPGLGILCSIQLSYERTLLLFYRKNTGMDTPETFFCGSDACANSFLLNKNNLLPSFVVTGYKEGLFHERRPFLFPPARCGR